jgi:hypothetical protein
LNHLNLPTEFPNTKKKKKSVGEGLMLSVAIDGVETILGKSMPKNSGKFHLQIRL